MTADDGVRYGRNVFARGQLESVTGWGLPPADVVDGWNSLLDDAVRANAARHQTIIQDAYELEGAGKVATAPLPAAISERIPA